MGEMQKSASDIKPSLERVHAGPRARLWVALLLGQHGLLLKQHSACLCATLLRWSEARVRAGVQAGPRLFRLRKSSRM
jgi:hypothetical protein